MDLKDKVAVVTGAASGIGEAVAEAYAAQGAKVVVSDIAVEAGEAVAAAIRAKGGQAVFCRADTASVEDNQALVACALREYGGLHVACNNAGIGGGEADTGEYPVADWERVIGINLSGVFYGMRAQLPVMLQSGGGSIVNMASILGQVGLPRHGAYVAAKHGVVGLTKSTAIEYAQRGIRVNAVGPAFIDTPLLKNLPDAMYQGLAGLHPVGRLGHAREVAELVVWLSSDRASFVTGSYYPVDGGYLSQ